MKLILLLCLSIIANGCINTDDDLVQKPDQEEVPNEGTNNPDWQGFGPFYRDHS